ncbi:sterol desaturase family protein [Maribacter algicola]|uniref:Sterol desaturase family protein n=1 Tax=Meishania litoralis TaxID=3434685 RepID=A0ACC7LMB2_9FLAO
MESYAQALLYAIPFFLILLIFEISYGFFIKDQKHKVMDSVSSISSGFTNIIKDTLGLGIILVSYPLLLKYLAITEIKTSWVVWLIAFVAIDFASYWNHRLNHKVNIFWNQHVIHHSSEEFNLACALRQPISNIFGYFALLLIPAAVLGVPNEIIAVLAPIHLFAQFWYHTQHIGKLGWLEYIIVTPSQHRVHHAINPEYIDKNLAAIFCIWDRWFGTFQEELDDVPPQYGVLKPASTWNPVLINFQHFWRLTQDAWRTKSFKDKLRIWFMPTGWRPNDVKEKYPIKVIEDVYGFARYETSSSPLFDIYVIFQLLITVALLWFMFFNYSQIGIDGLLLFGTLVFVGIYGYTSLMDRKQHAVWIEVLRGGLGIAMILWTKDWFGINAYFEWGAWLVAIYFAITILGSIYFTFFEKNTSPSQLPA